MPTTPHIRYQGGLLHIEDVALPAIADAFETPCYCYSAAGIRAQYEAFTHALKNLPATIHYSVKANPSLAVLRLLANRGSGADVVSRGEIHRALAAGIPGGKIIFSGAGKSPDELAYALDTGIAQINVESHEELEQLAEIAASKGATARVAVRVNPDVDAQTHKKITTGTTDNKFGIPWQEAETFLRRASSLPSIEIVGLAMHIGSQIVKPSPFDDAFARLAALAEEMRSKGFPLQTLDLGGGLGTNYESDAPLKLKLEDYANTIRKHFGALPYRLLLEPGRALVADAGVLLTRVLQEKHSGTKRFLIVDAAMNDLMRPALYDAHHDIVPVVRTDAPLSPAEVVGPVCETSDTLARNIPLPPLASGDLLAILQAGAYGASLASMYNSRLRVPEVLVSGSKMAAVYRRPDYDEMLKPECIPEWLDEDIAK